MGFNMSKELPLVGQNNGVSVGAAPKGAHPLKISTTKINGAAQEIMAQLNKLGSESETPSDTEMELAVITQRINRLQNVPENLKELHENTIFRVVFPIMETLNDE